MEIERPLVVETVIPGFAYGTDSAPPAPLQTLGTRLLLVCHERVSPETVARFLDFLGRAWRQRRQARTDELFGAYMLRVAEVER